VAEIKGFFESGFYKSLFYSGGLPGIATNFIHRALERLPPPKGAFYPVTLEIGGGEGFHVEWVKPNYDKYILSDVQTRTLETAAQELQRQGRLEFRLLDAHRIELSDESVDRVILMCVLHHLDDPEKALNEARRVCRSGGLISIYLPCDPGLMYGVFRRLLLRKRVNELDLDYDLVSAREHRNHFPSLRILLEYVFRNDKISSRWFPLAALGFHFNFFVVFNVRKVSKNSMVKEPPG
jgi:phosphatidylethanolamine/phosphatidyl-N-methylethanolamine N-methyltransferase